MVTEEWEGAKALEGTDRGAGGKTQIPDDHFISRPKQPYGHDFHSVHNQQNGRWLKGWAENHAKNQRQHLPEGEILFLLFNFHPH